MAPPRKKVKDEKLYEIVGVNPNATQEEISKAYKKRALAVHPDKNASKDAKEHFQHLQKAYLILKDPEKRRLYDETGCDDEDEAAFDAAYQYYYNLWPRIDKEAIKAFEATYKGSESEREDLLSFYARFGGDVTNLLEWIPLSDESDVDRFLDFFKSQFKKKLAETKKFSSSIPLLRKKAAAYKKKGKKEAKELENKENGMENLVLALQANQRRRATGLASLIESLETKHVKEAKQAKKTLKNSGKGIPGHPQKTAVSSKKGKKASR